MSTAHLFPEARVPHFRCISQIAEAKFFTAFCLDITEYHLHSDLSVLKFLQRKKKKKEKKKEEERVREKNEKKEDLDLEETI